MTNSNVFGSRLLAVRNRAGLNQKELGEAIGLSHKAISTIERVARGTTIEKVVALSCYFHVSTDYLLGITDDPAWRGK